MRHSLSVLLSAAVLAGGLTAANAQAIVVDGPPVYASERDYDRARDAYDERRDYERDLIDRNRDYRRDQRERSVDYWRDRRDDWRDRRADGWRPGYGAFGRGDCQLVERRRENWDGSITVRRTQVCD